MDCKETFSDIVAVWPFSSGELDYKIPFNVRSRFVTVSDLFDVSMDALLEGRDCYSVGDHYDGNVVEMAERESSLKSVTKRSVGGRYYEVTLTLVISENSRVSANMMNRLEEDRNDFIVLIASGEFLLLRSSDMGYECNVDEDFSDTYRQKVVVEMDCYNGIQRMI